MIFNTAFAQDSGAATGGTLGSFLPLILIVVLFYFLLIRPQQKRAKEHRAMLAALAVGDEVVTGSGILGTVETLKEQEVTLNLGNSKVRFQRHSIQAILPKGTIE